MKELSNVEGGGDTECPAERVRTMHEYRRKNSSNTKGCCAKNKALTKARIYFIRK